MRRTIDRVLANARRGQGLNWFKHLGTIPTIITTSHIAPVTVFVTESPLTGCRQSGARASLSASSGSFTESVWGGSLHAMWQPSAVVPAQSERLVLYDRRCPAQPAHRKSEGGVRSLVNGGGAGWTGNAIRCRFRRLRRRLREELPADLCCHCLRHTYAMDALQRGVDPITVAELMEHADVSMVARVAQHVAQRVTT